MDATACSSRLRELRRAVEHRHGLRQMLVLASLTGAGARPYAATLHESDGGIEVRIDDRPVGTVRGAEVDALRPLVSHTASLGRLPVARASVHGSAHSPELMLRVCREP